MSKNFKILLFLIAFGITAVLIMIVVVSQKLDNGLAGEIKNIGNREEPEVKVDLEKMREEYKEGISGAFAEFSDLSKNEELDLMEIEDIKSKALDLKLPAEFKNLHLEFILALTRIEDFLKTGSEEAKIVGEDLIDKIKNSYPWILATSNK